jgi:hypothetical protein
MSRTSVRLERVHKKDSIRKKRGFHEHPHSHPVATRRSDTHSVHGISLGVAILEDSTPRDGMAKSRAYAPFLYSVAGLLTGVWSAGCVSLSPRGRFEKGSTAVWRFPGSLPGDLFFRDTATGHHFQPQRRSAFPFPFIIAPAPRLAPSSNDSAFHRWIRTSCCEPATLGTHQSNWLVQKGTAGKFDRSGLVGFTRQGNREARCVSQQKEGLLSLRRTRT